MMAIARQVIPAGKEPPVARHEPETVRLGAAKVRRTRQQPLELRLAPEEDAHVEAAGHRAVEQVEERAAGTGQEEVALHEGDGRPDAGARSGDRGGDPAERRHAVDEGANRIPVPQRVRPSAGRRDPVGHCGAEYAIPRGR